MIHQTECSVQNWTTVGGLCAAGLGPFVHRVRLTFGTPIDLHKLIELDRLGGTKIL
jgi:hypothetical protein